MSRRPEILAPAGDRDAMSAALAAGADAVYFGLDDGFNARARAANFASDGLAEIAAWVHRAGAKAFVTLNTLVFEGELPIVEELVRRVAASGCDAIIVQDPAVCLMAKHYGLEVHGSTQMTASSPLAAELLKDLGLARVVVPRELSVDEIRAYAAGTTVPLEVFIHGALCVAWSGQCLSSEAWGGRSANRGQCAQACRLPYSLVVDGVTRDLGEVAYLLSPKDLMGSDAVPALTEIGVASLKIEGRLKGPAYVASAVAHYKGVPSEIPHDKQALEVAYSRGGSSGFLSGANHQTLVEGRFPRHRGAPLGRVIRVDGDRVVVRHDPRQRPVTGGAGLKDQQVVDSIRSPHDRIEPRAGMGVVFDRGRPEEDEEGGPIFAVSGSVDEWTLTFGRPGPDLSRVRASDYVWISSDPKVTRAGEKAAEAGYAPLGRLGLTMVASGDVGQPLLLTCEGFTATSTSVLQPARAGGITKELLADKLGALGGTAYHLADLDCRVAPGLHLPVSELKELRRQLVVQLDARVDTRELPEAHLVPIAADLPTRARIAAAALQLEDIAPLETAPLLVPLCRDDAQLDAVLAAGAREVELDWMELVGLGKAVERARAAGARVGVATVRVQKPGEERIDAHLAKLAPDHILVRSWGSLAALRDSGIPLHGDFSLNVTNSITARWVLARGLTTLTAAHDLDRDQLLALLGAAPAGRIGVTVHHHIPTFHTEHCIYAHLLSHGRDYRTCGRPCEEHRVALEDRVGLVHPVIVDVGCRNTVFNAQAQSAAALVPDLLARGVRRFRLELVRETAAETTRLVAAYTKLVAGQMSPSEVVKTASVHEQFGVTRGTMRTLTVLR